MTYYRRKKKQSDIKSKESSEGSGRSTSKNKKQSGKQPRRAGSGKPRPSVSGARPTNRGQGRQAKKKAVSNINPELLVKKAVKSKKVAYKAERTYDEMQLHKLLSANIAKKGYVNPTEIQDKSIEPLSQGKNLIGVAATGTGKTGAFLIPIIQQMIHRREVTALVVVPTRELAQQVTAEFESLAINTGQQNACFIGGTNINKDITQAKRKLRLIVATPGRLNDLIDRGALKINRTSILVLDEFDRMLDMGFIRDIQKIVAQMGNRKQTMLFSATVDPSQEKLINEIVNNPLRIKVSGGTKASDNVDQDIIHVAESEKKFDLLMDLLNDHSFEKGIIFAETKRTANKLCKQLLKASVSADVIHSNKSQNYRSKAIDRLKQGEVKVLVATDVAARGIDIDGVTHVINYQLPKTMDSYIHRIGRTGRADASGKAYTFVN